MNVYQGLLSGVWEIRSRKAQSFLTLFGVTVGITSVVTMTGIMSALQTRMTTSIQRAGQGRIFIWPRPTLTNHERSAGLVYEDALAIQRNFPDTPTVSPVISGRDNLFLGDFNAKIQVTGVTPAWTNLDWNYTLKGRFFNNADMKNFAKVCVLIERRHDLMEFWRQDEPLDPLFKRYDPLGKDLRIGENAFRVIGVLQEGPRDNLINFEMGQKNVLIPITTLQKRVYNDKKVLYMINLDSGDAKTSGMLGKRVFALLKRRHRGVEDFRIQNISEKLGEAMKWADTMAIVMWAVAAIALFAGGVGIMNITLASVHARIKEIGIRKSVGARERDIQLQFLSEAIALSLTGGVLGVLAGCGLCWLVKLVAHMAVLPSPSFILFSLILSAGVGILSAWYPARQASRLDPIETLRYE